MPVTPSLDSTRCPLCGQANQCAIEVELATGLKQPPCWCAQTTFTAALLSKIPEPARGKACLCTACAELDAP